MSIFLAHVGESGHSEFRNPIVNQIEQRLIRERPHRTSSDDVWRVLTSEPVESMARRASQLEGAFPPEVWLRSGTELFVVRVLAQRSADCA